jgi:hypothetical protein
LFYFSSLDSVPPSLQKAKPKRSRSNHGDAVSEATLMTMRQINQLRVKVPIRTLILLGIKVTLPMTTEEKMMGSRVSKKHLQSLAAVGISCVKEHE